MIISISTYSKKKGLGLNEPETSEKLDSMGQKQNPRNPVERIFPDQSEGVGRNLFGYDDLHKDAGSDEANCAEWAVPPVVLNANSTAAAVNSSLNDMMDTSNRSIPYLAMAIGTGCGLCFWRCVGLRCWHHTERSRLNGRCWSTELTKTRCYDLMILRSDHIGWNLAKYGRLRWRQWRCCFLG